MEFYMNRMEPKKSDSCAWQSHLGPENSKWLAENINEIDKTVKRMLKLIEENDESLTMKDQMHCQNKPELTAIVDEFYNIYRSLAERYDHLTGELQKSVPLEFQMKGSGNSEPGSDNGSPLVTPDEKKSLHKSGHLSAYFSCGGVSSDLSLREGTESPSSSSSSSDSDSESFNSSVHNYLGSPVNTDSKGLNVKVVGSEAEFPCMKEKLQVADKENGDSILKVGEQENYQELMGRINEYLEELRASNLKLQLSEKEVLRLKSELEKSESVIALAGNVHTELESAQRDIKMREADLEMERRRGYELQKQVVELETHVSDSKSNTKRLMEELEVSRDRLKGSVAENLKLKQELAKAISEGAYQVQGQLKLAQESIVMLEAELDSERRQVIDLQETILWFKADLSDRDRKVNELKAALCDARGNFSVEKAKLQSDITSLSERQTVLEARLKEWELRGESFEDKITKYDAEKMEMKALHDVQEVGWQGEINRLKAELAVKGEHVDTLNKNLDRLKLKYDMLMAEKDGVTAKVDTLAANVRSQDIQIGQMEEHLRQLRGKHKELISESESAQKQVDQLRVRVEELEKEVDRQRIVILDGAEEKREAIRQLCFSLDHYKSGYRELCQAFPGHKRHAVMAS